MLRILALILLYGSVLPAEVINQPHIEVELINEKEALVPHAKNWIGIRYKIEKGWHVYWQNPGDSGEPPKTKWTLTNGWSAGKVFWPAPERIAVGPLVNFGFEGTVLLMVPVEGERPGKVKVVAEARWLVCKEECIPGEAKFEKVLSVHSEAVDSRWQGLFEKQRASLPNATESQATVTESESSWKLNVRLDDVDGIKGADFFPFAEGQIRNAAEQKLEKGESGLTLELEKHENAGARSKLGGVLVVRRENQTQALTLSVDEGEETSLATLFLFAFLGGLLLNLMPCVFPILFIKIFGFLEQAKEGASPVIHSGLYGFGILVSFWALAGTLLALRAGGQQLGWGFQLQSPLFIAALSYTFMALGLSFIGIFEFGSSFANMGGRLGSQKGYLGSFFTGVLATIVATPCTAPFMGTALGFALTQDAFVALCVFSFLGIGMAFPYVLLSIWPGLIEKLPKPGSWMVLLKELMAFPLFATVAWLIFVFSSQTSPQAAFRLMLGLIAFSFGLWILGKRFQAKMRIGLSLIVMCLGVYVGGGELKSSQSGAAYEFHALWEPFSEKRLSEVLEEKKPVFINFTATWCITCQVNEKVVFSQKSVLDAFKKHGVHLFEADWTHENPEISAQLRKFGREGVPVYALYSGKSGERPRLLPQLLTPAVVIEALEELK